MDQSAASIGFRNTLATNNLNSALGKTDFKTSEPLSTSHSGVLDKNSEAAFS